MTTEDVLRATTTTEDTAVDHGSAMGGEGRPQQGGVPVGLEDVQPEAEGRVVQRPAGRDEGGNSAGRCPSTGGAAPSPPPLLLDEFIAAAFPVPPSTTTTAAAAAAEANTTTPPPPTMNAGERSISERLTRELRRLSRLHATID
eukprot:GHVU01032238.1.p1 GENE.GHVU01032238.1~~GHVU01032238.1.p1  ORF type:complete len:144 (-),score=33.69 GHVU01032238.1:42-473(-)